jgi:hypothetical protein
MIVFTCGAAIEVPLEAACGNAFKIRRPQYGDMTCFFSLYKVLTYPPLSRGYVAMKRCVNKRPEYTEIENCSQTTSPPTPERAGWGLRKS